MVTVLKLGGSVITEKEHPEILATERVDQIADRLQSSMTDRLILILGGGSFGHPAADRHGLSVELGTHDARAIADVHGAMLRLVDHVIERLVEREIPAVAFHPMSMGVRDGDTLTLSHDGVQAAFEEGFIPTLHGDGIVTVDDGVTILSGDTLVADLAHQFDADRVGLCSRVPGVLDEEGKVIDRIEHFSSVSSVVGESDATDVTGGMAGKVETLLDLGIPASVFDLDSLGDFLEGAQPGTTIDGSRVN